MHSNQPRLLYLDGLRGVAIILVLCWHFLGPTDAAFLPYQNTYSGNPVIRNGWMGVELFFLISGFVIFMTIERCSSFVDFLLRRWLRLFPTMLIASVILFVIDRAFRLDGPASHDSALYLLPGLTFIGPEFWHAATHQPIRSLDEVFWTMYVETSFYVVFGFLYFRIGWRWSIAALLALAIGATFAPDLVAALRVPAPYSRAIEPLRWLGFANFGWFSSGALFYKAATEGGSAGRRPFYGLAVFAGLLSILIFRLPLGVTAENRIGLCLILGLFSCVQSLPKLQDLFSFRPFVFAGFISYPLYLVHNNLGIALLGWVGRNFTGASIIGIVPVVAIVIALAWTIARFLDRPLTRILRPGTDRVRRLAHVARS